MAGERLGWYDGRGQRRADERLPHLLAVPAAVRFLSYEPALGPVDLRGWGNGARTKPDEKWRDVTWEAYLWEDWIPAQLRKLIADFWSVSYGRGPLAWLRDHVVQQVPRTGARLTLAREGEWLATNKMASQGVIGRYVHLWNNIGRIVDDAGEVHATAGGSGSGWLSRWLDSDGRYRPRLHWVIGGGESGPGRRPCEVTWFEDVARQCSAPGVAYFMKQDGGPGPGRQGRISSETWALKQFPPAPTAASQTQRAAP